MKFFLYLNHILLFAAGFWFLMPLYPFVELPAAYAVAALAVYQLAAGAVILLVRLFRPYRLGRHNLENGLIWIYWFGVLFFFFGALPNCKQFPWYIPVILAIFFTYTLKVEITGKTPANNPPHETE